jgi:ribosomal protein L11 methylase PrmA
LTALIKSPATIVTTAKARKSSVADRLFVTQEVAKISAAVDIVGASRFAEPLVQNVRETSDRVVSDASLALFGILAELAESVIYAHRERIAFELQTTDQTWVRLVGKRI